MGRPVWKINHFSRIFQEILDRSGQTGELGAKEMKPLSVFGIWVCTFGNANQNILNKGGRNE
jgi:hypothetical protein